MSPFASAAHLDELAEDGSEGETFDRRVMKRGVEVDAVAVAARGAGVEDEHAVAAEGADDAPDGALGEVEGGRDLTDGGVRAEGDVKEDAALR